MRKYNRITEDVFAMTKAILAGGKTQGETARLVGISGNTVNRIARAASFEEYVDITYANGCGKGVTKSEMKGEKTAISGAWMLERIFDEAKKQTALLTAISDKLAYIVVELTGAPEGTGENAEPHD